MLISSITACTPDHEEVTDLAGLDLERVSIYIGSNIGWGQLVPHRRAIDPCPVMTDDFEASVGGIPASVDPGYFEATCTDGESGCSEGDGYCSVPYFGFDAVPMENANAVIRDGSGSIVCTLGDSLAPRALTRVDAETWDVAPGDTFSARIAIHGELFRFYTTAWFADPNVPTVPMNFSFVGDIMTFQVPGLAPGPHTLYVHFAGGEDILCSGDVPAHVEHEYTMEVPLVVH